MEYKYKLDYKVIAKRIRSERRAAQMTQAELAEQIGISTNAVAKLETNLMNVSLQTLINIANVLEIDMNCLLSDNDDRDNTGKNVDILLDNLIQTLSMREKNLIIHIINGLKAYNMGEET